MNAHIIFSTTYIVKLYLKGLQGKPWHAVQRPGPGSLTRQSGWLQFHPGTQVNVRDGACPISKSQLFGFRKRYTHAAFVVVAKNTKFIPKSFITFFVPYKRAGTHFSKHPAKRQYTPPSKKSQKSLENQNMGLFARLHRFYRKKLPAVRWLPFLTNLYLSSSLCP